jgi:SAM-dependent methyltransferase
MWRQIWEQKGSVDVGDYDLDVLIALDGFDSGAGKLSGGQFRELAALATNRLELRHGMRLLEVGCGAGALLWCLREQGLQLYGVDYSHTLIAHARAAIPEATFAVAEADQLPFEADAIVCHSVFQYFPDHDYARRVLAEFARAAPVALILDVPDLGTREISEQHRAEAGSVPSPHLYYPRSFFAGATWTNDLPGYGNAPFRFHALLEAL